MNEQLVRYTIMLVLLKANNCISIRIALNNMPHFSHLDTSSLPKPKSSSVAIKTHLIKQLVPSRWIVMLLKAPVGKTWSVMRPSSGIIVQYVLYVCIRWKKSKSASSNLNMLCLVIFGDFRGSIDISNLNMKQGCEISLRALFEKTYHKRLDAPDQTVNAPMRSLSYPPTHH